MNPIAKVLDRCSSFLKFLGALALTSMMLLTVVDVIGRFFKHPIFGSVELVGFMAVIVAAAALPFTYKMNGHVGVEILVRLLPKKTRIIIDIITRLLTFALFGVITWQMFLYAGDIRKTGEVSMNLEFPITYIIFVLAVGLLIFSMTILESIVDDINQLRKAYKK
ncbi:TRAP transporter small permease [Desulfospira joergensenii]|uniref:TRAP transporter small permease n=1 Tax=Desulfospira joergensenii TaxID=53329 RepID=UPI0003B79462|nr:TRAP transporter small permease [Desulfospira joergensenii]